MFDNKIIFQSFYFKFYTWFNVLPAVYLSFCQIYKQFLLLQSKIMMFFFICVCDSLL